MKSDSLWRDCTGSLAAFAIALSWGCVSTKQANQVSTEPGQPATVGKPESKPKPDFWYLKEEPDTFYPVGLPSDFKVTATSGEWLFLDKGNFLIPLDGTAEHTHTEILQQALAMRSDAEIRKARKAKTKTALNDAAIAANPVSWFAAACSN